MPLACQCSLGLDGLSRGTATSFNPHHTRRTAQCYFTRDSKSARSLGQTPSCRGLMTCNAAAAVDEQVDFTWKGSDEFSGLQDRQDLPPLPLPHIKSSKRVVLVRHGQSTWNAEGRIQGSTDFALLTPKGEAQAETTRQMLENDKFDILFHSPLKRAAKTATIIWGSRPGKPVILPTLREIDLYSFQGLLKDEGKARFGDQFKVWQQRAADFVIDNQAPIRELWYRASLAWQEILGRQESSSALVTAHNAVNQALVATAVGFPPTMFRRLLQSNGATTVLDFRPVRGGPPTITINRLNQSPGPPFGKEAFLRKGAGRLVLVRAGATDSRQEGRLLGLRDEPLATLGTVQAQKVAELIMDIQVDLVVSSPLARARQTAEPISQLQVLAGNPAPPVESIGELRDRDWGSFEGRIASEVRDGERCKEGESLPEFGERTRRALEHLCTACHEEGGRTVVVVAHSAVLSAFLCHCLELSDLEASLSLFRTDGGSVTVVDFPDSGRPTYGIVRCVNYTAHLGRWAIPITREDLDSDLVCGIDGCF